MLRALIFAALVVTGLAAAAPQSDRLVIGHSVRGQPIVAYERGDPSAPVTLVVGVIHGTEPAGLAVIRDLRTMPLAKEQAGAEKQVTNGGGGMPAFKGILSEEEIENVAAYVVEEIVGGE